MAGVLMSRAAPAQEPVESTTRIQAAAVDAARERTGPSATLGAGRLDSRLRLPACPAPLSAQVQSDRGGAMSVEVRCDAAGWKLFVPVDVRQQVPVLVLRRALNRGQVPVAADVAVETRERATLPGAWLDAPAQLEGRMLTRALPAGSVLMPSQLAAPHRVQRGQAVQLVGAAGGFEVRMQGKAMGNAAVGERVRVENPSSRRVVEGEVQADGSVAVRL